MQQTKDIFTRLRESEAIDMRDPEYLPAIMHMDKVRKHGNSPPSTRPPSHRPSAHKPAADL